jgi:hypothetical protein
MASREERFAALTQEYARVVTSAIRRVCSRRYRALIPDVEQEVRLALWKRIEGGKEIEHPATRRPRLPSVCCTRCTRSTLGTLDRLPFAGGEGGLRIGAVGEPDRAASGEGGARQAADSRRRVPCGVTFPRRFSFF